MEAEKCYYCKNKTDATPYRNPHTKEIHPTCKNCIKEFTSFAKERSFFTRFRTRDKAGKADNSI